MGTYELDREAHPSPVGSPRIVFVAVVLANVVAAAIVAVLGSSTAGLITFVAGLVIAAGLAMWRRGNDARPLQVDVDDTGLLIARGAGEAPVPWGRVAACDVVEVRDHGRALVVTDDAADGGAGGGATMTAVLARVAALTGRGPAGAGWCGWTRRPTPTHCWPPSASPQVGGGPPPAPS